MNDSPPPQSGPGPEKEPEPEFQLQMPPSKWMPYIIAAVIFSLIYVFFVQAPVKEPRYEIPYTEFKLLLKQERVKQVLLKGEIAEGSLYDPSPIGPENAMGVHFRTRIPSFGELFY
jgi:hypothetical protein